MSTLRYANRAKNIKNNAKINEDPKDAMLRQYQQELESLRKQLESGDIKDDEKSGESSPDDDEDNGKSSSRNKSHDLKKLEIQKRIESDRKKLEEQKDMAAEERRKIQIRLEQQEDELQKVISSQNAMQSRIKALKKSIIVGGENLLEKAEEQERLLQESAIKLEAQQRKSDKLKEKLKVKEEKRINVEEKYNSLQEEAAAKRKLLRKMGTMYLKAKSELQDMRAEHVRDMEGLLDSIRQLNRDVGQQNLIINHFIPKIYQELIEKHMKWNEELGEWQLRYVAYSGNNMRRGEMEYKQQEAIKNDIYLSYVDGMEMEMGAQRRKTATRKAR